MKATQKPEAFEQSVEGRMKCQETKKGKNSIRRKEVPKDLRFQQVWDAWSGGSLLPAGTSEGDESKEIHWGEMRPCVFLKNNGRGNNQSF